MPSLLPPAPAAPPYAAEAPPGTPWVTTVERSNVRAFGRVRAGSSMANSSS